jgi:hypothetical protein
MIFMELIYIAYQINQKDIDPILIYMPFLSR